jgi:hypothetical protein
VSGTVSRFLAFSSRPLSLKELVVSNQFEQMPISSADCVDQCLSPTLRGAFF